MSDGGFRLHLARHAETLFNATERLQGWCDSPLTPRGRDQAEGLAERFAEVPLTAIFASDLGRARETAGVLASRHPELEVRERRSLREWHYGGWEARPNDTMWEPAFAALGLSLDEGRAHWQTMSDSDIARVIDAISASDAFGYAEDAADVDARVTAAVAELLQAGAELGGDVLVVSHGTMLASIIGRLAPGSSRPRFPNCGFVTVTVAGESITLGELVGG